MNTKAGVKAGEVRAQDLRVGNWVNWYLKPIQITAITKDWVQLHNEMGHYRMNEIEPIPLTPEILEAAGFAKDNFGDYSILFGKGTTANGLFLVVDMDDMTVRLGQIKHYSHQFGSVNYLHQLQNLCYCICGTELEIKLQKG